MGADAIQLNHTPTDAPLRLRELRGRDEQEVADGSTRSAIELLDALLVDAPGGAAALTASDRDRLLAAVYTRAYGPRVASTAACRRCEAAFDADFDLRELVEAARPPDELSLSRRVERGVLELPDGRRVRIPTGADERAVEGLPAERSAAALLERCLAGGDPDGGRDALEAAIEEAAPVLDIRLGACCPECGEEQEVRFDVQSYLLGALLRERALLDHDVHRLARAYGWSIGEILDLPRDRRRALVELVEQERAAREPAA
jgi:hypothetical protein